MILNPVVEAVSQVEMRIVSGPRRRPRAGGDPSKVSFQRLKWISRLRGNDAAEFVSAAFHPAGERAKLPARYFQLTFLHLDEFQPPDLG